MSDTLEHCCALQSTRGINYDYVPNQERIHFHIKDLCICTGEDRKEIIIWLGRDVLYIVIQEQRFLMEFKWSRISLVRGEDCCK